MLNKDDLRFIRTSGTVGLVVWALSGSFLTGLVVFFILWFLMIVLSLPLNLIFALAFDLDGKTQKQKDEELEWAQSPIKTITTTQPFQWRCEFKDGRTLLLTALELNPHAYRKHGEIYRIRAVTRFLQKQGLLGTSASAGGPSGSHNAA